jgi:hypothetical protein
MRLVGRGDVNAEAPNLGGVERAEAEAIYERGREVVVAVLVGMRADSHEALRPARARGARRRAVTQVVLACHEGMVCSAAFFEVR